jgi:hypothetical protein
MATSLQYAIPGSFAQTFTVATAALSVGQQVKMGATAGTVVACSAATDPFIGVVQSDAAAVGDSVSIVVSGPCYALCGGAIAASTGGIATSDAAGAAVAWTAAGSNRQNVKIIGYGGEPGGGSLTTAAGNLRTAIVLAGNVVD